jgi:hypothetical protein
MPLTADVQTTWMVNQTDARSTHGEAEVNEAKLMWGNQLNHE